VLCVCLLPGPTVPGATCSAQRIGTVPRRAVGDISSPAYGTLNDYQFLRRRQRSQILKKEWGVLLKAEADVFQVRAGPFLMAPTFVSAYCCYTPVAPLAALRLFARCFWGHRCMSAIPP